MRGVSFDDPGRTKANVGAIALFGVLGLASRYAFTLITLSTRDEELYFENGSPFATWRSTARRIIEEVPAAQGKIWVAGQLVTAALVDPPSWPAGWYADPSSPGVLRRYDGQSWTEDIVDVPAPPSS